MKQLVCEMCGSTDLVKQDGLFVCQTCGCKYSVEEAKKMMVEGVVEVTGTVKVDNSEKIEKMLINARRAFADRKYAEAQSLFGQVLNEDTENAEAILYQGLALGWQGNAVRYTMDKAGEATERAIEISHASSGDSPEFEQFAIEALQQITDLGFALAELCEKTRNEAIDRFSKQLDDYKRRLREMSIYGDPQGLKRSMERDQARMNEQVEKFGKIKDNTLLIVLSAYDKAVSMLGNIEVYSSKTYDKLIKQLSTFEKKAVYKLTVMRADGITNKLKKYKKEIDDKAERARKKAIEDYWNNHKEEKKALEDERSQLKTEKNELEKQEKDFIKQEKTLKEESEKKVAAVEEKEEIKKKIEALNSEKAGLGLFKGKEKKAIDAQVSELQTKMNVLEPVIKEQEAEQKKEYENKLAEVQSLKKPITDRLKAIEKRNAQIEKELTKNR